MRIGPLLFTAARPARPRWDDASEPEPLVGNRALARLASITAVLLGAAVFWLLMTALSR